MRDACWAIGLRGGEVGAGEEVVGGFAGVMEFEPGGVVRGLFSGIMGGRQPCRISYQVWPQEGEWRIRVVHIGGFE